MSVERGEQAGHEPRARDEAVDLDVLVERVEAGAAGAEAVERGNAERAGEVGVGSAAVASAFGMKFIELTL